MSVKIHEPTTSVDDWRAGVVEHADPNHEHAATALQPHDWRALAEAKMRDRKTLEEFWFVMRTTGPQLRRPIVSLPARWGPLKYNFDNAIRQASAIRPGAYGPDSRQRIVVVPVDQYVKSERDAGRA